MSQKENRQVTDARAYIAKAREALEAITPKRRKQYLMGLLGAETNHEGAISGDALARASVGPQMHIPKQVADLREACEVHHQEVVQKAAVLWQRQAQHTIALLNNPEFVEQQDMRIAVNDALTSFAGMQKINVGKLDPAAHAIIEQGVQAIMFDKDKRLIDAYSELRATQALGALPRQVLPMTPQDLCGAVSSQGLF